MTFQAISGRGIGWLLGLSLLAVPVSGVAQTGRELFEERFGESEWRVLENAIGDVEIDELFERGSAAYGEGNYVRAEEVWRTVIERDSDNAIARVWLGLTLYDQGKLDEAIAAFRRAIDLDPDYAFAHNGLGVALSDQGKLDEAIAAFRRALDLDPDYAVAHTYLGMALRQQGKLDEAIAAYRRAIDLDPNYARAHNEVGVALYDQGKLEEAIAAFRRAIDLDPDYAVAHNNLGIALRQQGQLEASLQTCRRALNLPEDTRTTPASAHTLAHNCLGLTLTELERYEEAIEAFDRSIALDPNFSPARTNRREAERLLVLARNAQPAYPDDRQWLPEDDPDTPLLRSIVLVLTEHPNNAEAPLEAATGWVIQRNGNTLLVLTNRHAVRDDREQLSDSIEVEFFSEPPADNVRRRQPARVIRIADAADLALLEVQDAPEDIQPLPIVSERTRRGTEIRIISHPSTGLPWSLTSGEVSNLNREVLQIGQAVIATGSSGAPVLDDNNRVVGIVVEVTDDRLTPATGGFGQAYPMSYIIRWLEQWDIDLSTR